MMLGKVSKVNVRTMWKHEALDFTPWLAANLDRLSELLGMDLELITREAEAGDFSLDILARDLSTNHKVVIENQFNPTDHKHLGQLITYASFHEAEVVVWISEEFREEHRSALDWLNANTSDELSFFGVEIELIQIDNSRPALNLKLKASPNTWTKSSQRASQSDITEQQRRYVEYFQGLIDVLRDKHSFTKATKSQPQNWYSFSSGVSGLQYSTSFARGERVRVELYIDTNDFERNKHIFRELQSQSSEIQSSFDIQIEWEELSDKRASRIAIYSPGSINDDSATLAIIRDWAVSSLLLFKQVFEPRIKKYR
ncbi:MAG: DUF4268 domain-containing protein [Candidatus Kapabacteria bacterium]|nr:DUF4268 domain-containing protein [Candidatus Kapabacteria bacterium]